MKTIYRLILSFFCLCLWACSDNTIPRVGISTTLEDAGLLPGLLQAFEQQTGQKIQPIIAGSGHLHTLIKRGDIDSAISHHPAGEKHLLAHGHIHQRIPLMHNDFLIVGPASDPAHIQQALAPDEALKKIVNAHATFISRGDQSGTHQMENHWWQQAQRTPPAARYLKTGSGMGATLSVAAERNAYTLVDRGSWLNFKRKQQLVALFEDAALLPNQYSILSLSQPVAREWEAWLQSDRAQALIANYRIHTQTVFSPTEKAH